MRSYQHLYQKSFEGKENYLHFAAHSHHPWPDCTAEAHQQYWKDSTKLLDEKWDHVFSKIIPDVQKNIAQVLNLSKPNRIAIAPNTHEFVTRLFSCFDFSKKVKILTTDSEFHSYRRQMHRYMELPNAQFEVINVEPFDTFEVRWLEKIKTEKYDFIFTSHVFFNSGLECVTFEKWIPLVPQETIIAIDGYHSFCAIPIDFKKWQDRAFFLAGGYKYAQAGEGICFMSVPQNNLRPLNTGWFADFASLSKPNTQVVSYSLDGMQFAGSTFEVSGCYRWNAVCEMFKKENLNVDRVHAHVMELKKYFTEKVRILDCKELDFYKIIFNDKEWKHLTEAHFITFRTPDAQKIQSLLEQNDIIVDSRGDRLRFGFGIYHDLKSIDALIKKLSLIFSKKTQNQKLAQSAQPQNIQSESVS